MPMEDSTTVVLILTGEESAARASDIFTESLYLSLSQQYGRVNITRPVPLEQGNVDLQPWILKHKYDETGRQFIVQPVPLPAPPHTRFFSMYMWRMRSLVRGFPGLNNAWINWWIKSSWLLRIFLIPLYPIIFALLTIAIIFIFAVSSLLVWTPKVVFAAAGFYLLSFASLVVLVSLFFTGPGILTQLVKETNDLSSQIGQAVPGDSPSPDTLFQVLFGAVAAIIVAGFITSIALVKVIFVWLTRDRPYSSRVSRERAFLLQPLYAASCQSILSHYASSIQDNSRSPKNTIIVAEGVDALIAYEYMARVQSSGQQTTLVSFAGGFNSPIIASFALIWQIIDQREWPRFNIPLLDKSSWIRIESWSTHLFSSSSVWSGPNRELLARVIDSRKYRPWTSKPTLKHPSVSAAVIDNSNIQQSS